MKKNFEKDLLEVMNKEKEMPGIVRQSLNQSYDIIRAKSKKKRERFLWKSVIAAACALIISVVVLTNEQVMANISDFFSFGDKGIEQAINKGYAQRNVSTATDQDIQIAIRKQFSDSNKVGLSFQLDFANPSLLKNAREVSMDYRLKNRNEEYIEEFIPDNKPLKGNARYISSSEQQNPVLDKNTGRVQYEVILNSNQGNIPNLINASLEIESVNIIYNSGKSLKIDGDWQLSVATNANGKSKLTMQYVALNETVINITKAVANPTSFNLSFTLDEVYIDENTFPNHMRLTDEDGNEYQATNFAIKRINNKTIISTNFPLSSYSHPQKLKLSIDRIGEVLLGRKK